MNWKLISTIICATLVIRLLFWSDEDRQSSRWYYRVLLFVTTVYAGSIVVDYFYLPFHQVSPWVVLFHASLLIGAFIIRPTDLPWNIKHDSTSKTHSTVVVIISKLQFWLRDPELHSKKTKLGKGKHSPISSPTRFL